MKDLQVPYSLRLNNVKIRNPWNKWKEKGHVTVNYSSSIPPSLRKTMDSLFLRLRNGSNDLMSLLRNQILTHSAAETSLPSPVAAKAFCHL
jgi:hypothetical protein